jgi:transcriptional regulator with XRE-family HTH domain
MNTDKEGKKQMNRRQITRKVLDERRKELGLSKAALARKAGVSHYAITRIFDGRLDRVRLGTLYLVAIALGIDVELTKIN